jgi:hypothetical protein
MQDAPEVETVNDVLADVLACLAHYRSQVRPKATDWPELERWYRRRIEAAQKGEPKPEYMRSVV